MDAAEFFFEVNDPCRDGSCYHVFSDILMIVLCDYLADCDDFVEIYDYAVDKKPLLQQFLQLPWSIPSHDTLNRVFRLIEPTQLETTLTKWGVQIVGLLKGKQLIIDGKQLRGTRPVGRKHAKLQLISIWAEQQQLCLAQEQIERKTNEIKAIPDLLEPLDIAGSVVTIDAIACQEEITRLLVKDKKSGLCHRPEGQSRWLI